MKPLYLFILFCTLCQCCFAQNVKITIGRGTGCYGRGACSISTTNERTHNGTLILTEGKFLALRVYQDRLSEDERSRLLDNPIRANSNYSDQMTLPNTLQLNPQIQHIIKSATGKNFTKLEVKSYLAKVNENFIDIILLDL